jgi:hypothetical protein
MSFKAEGCRRLQRSRILGGASRWYDTGLKG